MESSEEEKHYSTKSDSFHQHLVRTRYLAYLLISIIIFAYKHYRLQIHSSLIGHGWHLVCLPVRSTQPPPHQSMSLPQAEMNCSGESSKSEDSCSLQWIVWTRVNSWRTFPDLRLIDG